MDKDIIDVTIDPEEFVKGLNKIIYDEILYPDEPLPGLVNRSDYNYDDSKYLVAIYKDKGMTKSKQMLMGDYISILTAICSTLDTCVDKIIPDPKVKEDIKILLNDLLRGGSDN